MGKASPFVVWLKASAYNTLLIESIKSMPNETGGIIIGYWGNTTEIVVTEIIGPGFKSVHREHLFVPDNDFHVSEIERIYKESGRTETYLGDWHTHPNSRAYLSSQDKRTLVKIASYKLARLTSPVMMVLGTKPFGLSAWLHTEKISGGILIEDIALCEIKIYESLT